jgi:hypothetical protein
MRRLAVLFVVAAVSGGCGAAKHAATTTAVRSVAVPASPAPPPFRASLSAPTHTPRVGPKWWYVVRAVDLHGRPLRGRLTVQVVDPLGTAHTAKVGTSTRKLLNFPFTGRYRDFAQWPAAARGFRLTFRAVVKAAGGSRTLTYWVKPR